MGVSPQSIEAERTNSHTLGVGSGGGFEKYAVELLYGQVNLTIMRSPARSAGYDDGVRA